MNGRYDWGMTGPEISALAEVHARASQPCHMVISPGDNWALWVPSDEGLTKIDGGVGQPPQGAWDRLHELAGAMVTERFAPASCG